MNKIKKNIAIMLIMFLIFGVINVMPTEVFAEEGVKINFVGVDHSPLVVGDQETFYITSKNAERVQYRVFISDRDKENWSEITDGYTAPVEASTPYAVKYEKKFTKGKYTIKVQVKEESSVQEFDNEYTIYLSCVDKDDNNRVYANNDMDIIDAQTGKAEEFYTIDKKIIIKGIKNVTGMKGPYKYKLHIFNPKKGEWIFDDKEYRENLEWTPKESGTYVIDIWAMSSNSTLWSKIKKDPKAKVYESWKLKPITVKNIDDKQALNVSLMNDIETLDSTKIKETSSIVLNEIMEGLTRTKNDGKKDIITPAAAKSWDVSKDGLTWTFHLREFTWSDGETVKAKDYEYAWKKALEPKSNCINAYLLYPIKGAKEYNLGQVNSQVVGVKAIDDKTLKVELEYPIPYFEQLVSYNICLPQRQDLVEKYGEKYGDIAFNFVSNGPFVISNWTKGESIEIIKNSSYWENYEVKLEKIRFNFKPNNETSLNEFQQKQIDMGIFTKDLEGRINNSNVNKFSYGTSIVNYILFNNRTLNKNDKENKVVNNQKVRLALSIALKREEISKVSLASNSKAANGLIPSEIKCGDINYRSKAGEPLLQYKNEEAKQLYKAGLKELNCDYEKTYSLDFLVLDGDENYKNIAENVKKQWENALNIKVNIIKVNFETFIANLQSGKFDIAQTSWKLEYNDPMSLLEIFDNETGWLYNFNNSKYEELISKVRKETDKVQRISYMNEIENLLVSNEAIVAPLNFEKNNIIIHTYVKDIENINSLGSIELKNAYIYGK